MESDAGRNSSYWMLDEPAFRLPPLAGDANADVCVIGAGIAGLTTAYLLAKAGKSVIVLDDGPLGGGETSRTSAHLSNALDDRYYELERLHGEQGARLAAQSHSAAINRIETLIAEENIACDFARVDGYLFLHSGASETTLARERDAAQRAGLDVQLIAAGIPLDCFEFGPVLRFGEQAQFHPVKYLNGLAAAILRRGGAILSAHADRIEYGKPLRVHAGAQAVTADAVVVATNSPINDLVTMHTKQAAYRSFVIALQIPKDCMPPFLAWDTGDPYHYVRSAAGGADAPHDVLIVGGEDHKTGQPQAASDLAFSTLESWTRLRFPMAGPVIAQWSGQIIEPNDGLAYIGRNPRHGDNVFIATGDSGNGLTHGTIAGMLLSDLILGYDNPWAELYDPDRITLRAAPEFARENLNVAMQYADLLKSGEMDAAEIKPGDGAILRRGLRQIAAYRDDSGQLHQHSALCTHLGCVVDWNATEKSWDCPCHGSRFDKLDGHPLNGPAKRALSPVDDAGDEDELQPAARRKPEGPAARN